jgi:hypothetical protein
MALTEQEELELLELEEQEAGASEKKPSLLQNLVGAAKWAATPTVSGDTIQKKFPISGAIGAAIPIMNTLSGMPTAMGGLDVSNPDLVQQGSQALSQQTSPIAILTNLLVGSSVAGKLAGKPIANTVSKLAKYDSNLTQARKGISAIEDIRTIAGEAVGLDIGDAAKASIELKVPKNIEGYVKDAIRRPEFQVEFDRAGNFIPTLENGNKMKKAIHDYAKTGSFTGKNTKFAQDELQKFYGSISEAMIKGAKDIGKDIKASISFYDEFMNRHTDIMKTLADKGGEAVSKGIKEVFKVGNEQRYTEAWKEISQISPEFNSVMNSMRRRALLKNLLGSVSIKKAARSGI